MPPPPGSGQGASLSVPRHGTPGQSTERGPPAHRGTTQGTPGGHGGDVTGTQRPPPPSPPARSALWEVPRAWRQARPPSRAVHCGPHPPRPGLKARGAAPDVTSRSRRCLSRYREARLSPAAGTGGFPRCNGAPAASPPTAASPARTRLLRSGKDRGTTLWWSSACAGRKSEGAAEDACAAGPP